MLKFDGITKIFDTDILKKNFTALDGLSFEVKSGEIIGFLGANGAGKTTSLKIAMDFISPSEGKVIYGKELGQSKEEIFKNIGYLPERPYFYPHLTGRDFCHYMGQLTDLSHKEILKQIEYWAPKFKIDHALDRHIKKYSKGMLQRIGFLITVLHNPRLVILDEPLSGLDPIGRKDLKDIIQEINNEGVTVFFSSHIISDVEEISKRVIFIKNGKLIYEGDVEKIINENLNLMSRLRYEQGGSKIIDIKSEEINEQILKIINSGGKIISVESERPTLEEIFYNVR